MEDRGERPKDHLRTSNVVRKEMLGVKKKLRRGEGEVVGDRTQYEEGEIRGLKHFLVYFCQKTLVKESWNMSQKQRELKF